MTDTAPPARTPLTPEERARLFFITYRPPDAQWYVDDVLRVGLTHAIREAEIAARAEGRLAGLVEAVVFLENEAHEYALIGLKEEVLAIDKCANALRWQAEDVPKAPKNQADQADPDPR